jgi:hypothetical protein
MNTLYRALLWLFPSGFRREYGAEMLDIFATDAARTGFFGRVALLITAIPSVISNASVLHWELLQQDVRYTFRTLRRSPGFAITAILVTAIGVGANTAAFSVADFVLRRPLDFKDPDTLVRLCAGPRHGPAGWGCQNQLSPQDYRDFKEQTKSFTGLGAFPDEVIHWTRRVPS